eukprot:Amastigsp_a525418_14.p2 type:complete len:161 gc:universal Amastigsp_a525418_14:184-666(+)
MACKPWPRALVQDADAHGLAGEDGRVAHRGPADAAHPPRASERFEYATLVSWCANSAWAGSRNRTHSPGPAFTSPSCEPQRLGAAPHSVLDDVCCRAAAQRARGRSTLALKIARARWASCVRARAWPWPQRGELEANDEGGLARNTRGLANHKACVRRPC